DRYANIILPKSASWYSSEDEHYHDVYYLYNTDGSGKRKLFELAENEKAVNLKTDATHLYGSIIDGSGMGAAFAVDLQSGEMIRNSNKYDIDGLGKIYSAGEYVLFATGKADPYTTAGGSLVIFDKGKGAFREINVTSVNETEHATITPDGKRIVTADSYRGSITDEEGGMLRVYDTKSGELIGSEKITMGSKPICGNEKIIICDSQRVREFTYAEMGLN
ncbi:MAG: hypothetical protein K2K57_06205, partial [Oscillospiraceae bacterium]|nr:hypothetical protein [Oscillospiraceae bacterium]